jgi:hypothetical protein
MKLDFDRIAGAVCAETEEEKTFMKYCKQYGLPATLLHSSIVNIQSNKPYEVVGLKKVGRLAYVLGLNISNKEYVALDIRKVCNKKYYEWEQDKC